MSAFSKNVTSKDIVCDNCGDVGFAEHIATCFRCNERSEHTYCMLNPPDHVPKYWQCEDCVGKSNGKPEKRKTILLDASEARKVATPIKRCRSSFTKDSMQLNDFKRQPPSARHSPLKMGDASTSRAKGKAPISSSALRVLSTPRNVRLTTMSRATCRMHVAPASNVPKARCQRANRASEPFARQGISTAQTVSIGSTAPETQSRRTNRASEPSVDQGVSTIHAANIGSRAPEDHSWGTNRASKPSVGQGVTENIGSSSQYDETAVNHSEACYLGNTTHVGTRFAIDKHQNTNSRHKQLVTTGGVPPHHPVPNVCWTGAFKIFDKFTNAFSEIQGIQAHIPSIVSLNVYETVKRLSVRDIKLRLFRSVDIWPALFVLEPPQLNDIGLFFFPSKEQRLKEKFTSFVNTMDKQGLAMKGHLPNAKILIFTSSQLPPDAHGAVPEVCLWGVLRGTRPKKQTAKDQEKLAAPPGFDPDAPPGFSKPLYRPKRT